MTRFGWGEAYSQICKISVAELVRRRREPIIMEDLSSVSNPRKRENKANMSEMSHFLPLQKRMNSMAKKR